MINSSAADDTFAAEIHGTDLSRPLDDDAFRAIEDLFNDRGVIFFRDQSLTPAQLIAFGRRFGAVEKHVRQEYSLDGFPEIHVLSNIKEGERTIGSAYAGDMWHSDLCFMKSPSRCSILHALEIPHDGNNNPLGDTLFASAAEALDDLDGETKAFVRAHRGVMQYNRRQELKRQERLHDHPRPPLTEAQKAKTPDITQPMVRTHPITGRKAIYVNETYTLGIDGMNDEDATPILRKLHEHVTRPDRIYRHRWRVGDVLMWDNCLVQHKAIGDYKLPQRRKMIRVSVSGTEVF